MGRTARRTGMYSIAPKVPDMTFKPILYISMPGAPWGPYRTLMYSIAPKVPSVNFKPILYIS